MSASDWIDRCYIGDVRDGLRTFKDHGVRAQCCVVSPPYWGLRDYGQAGQLGLEPTPAEYVAAMVDVFRCVRDVLADDGTLWLNLGDSYSGAGPSGASYESPSTKRRRFLSRDDNFAVSKTLNARGLTYAEKKPIPAAGLKPKDLVGIPWRVAFALQADGWYLRSDIIWHKPNPMPESVTDRPTKAHEYLFLLTKQERYYYDAAAIAEPTQGDFRAGEGGKWAAPAEEVGAVYGLSKVTGNQNKGRLNQFSAETRNRRTVWTVATQPYSEAHFATFPPALVEPCVMAGTSQRGHCPACGKGWERVVERTAMVLKRSERTHDRGQTRASGTMLEPPTSRTLGWQPTCECNAGDPVPGIVLDPFMGSGTVAQVAQDLGRRWIGCELNPEYVALQRRRTAQTGLCLAAAD